MTEQENAMLKLALETLGKIPDMASGPARDFTWICAFDAAIFTVALRTNTDSVAFYEVVRAADSLFKELR